MLALQITSMKNFMHHLLTSSTFDIFLLEEAILSTANSYTIDGHINQEFYTAEELEDSTLCPYEFAAWSEMKNICFQLIKGKRTPLSFKFVLLLKPEQMIALLRKNNSSIDEKQIKSLVLTVRYDGQKAVLTTGASYNTFVMNKEPEQIWDKALSKYLSDKGIEYEEL